MCLFTIHGFARSTQRGILVFLLIAEVLFISIGSSLFAASHNECHTLDNDRMDHFLHSVMDIYVDEERTKTFDDMIDPDMEKKYRNLEDIARFGYTDAAIWVRVCLHNKTASEIWFLEIRYPGIEWVDSWFPDNSGTWANVKGGYRLGFHARDIPYRNYAYRLLLPKGQTKTIYFRFQSEELMSFPMVLREAGRFIKTTSGEQLILGVYFGIMTILAFYNLVIYYTLKSRVYLYYVAFVSCFGLLQFGMSGLTYQYLIPESPWINKHLAFCLIGISMLFATLLTRSALPVERSMPRTDRLLKIYAWVCVGFGVMSLFNSYRLNVAFANTLPMIIILFALYIGSYLWYKGVRQAGFYLLAWIGVMAGALLNMGMGIGLLPVNLFTQHGLQFGSAFQAFTLSFSLAIRIDQLRIDKEKAHAQILEQQRNTVRYLEKVDKVKDEFLAKTSHELRTPLHGIIGLAESLLGDAGSDSNSEKKDRLSLIFSSAQRLSRLIDDILDISRIKHNDLVLHLKPVHLRSVFNVVTTLTKPLAVGKEVTLSVDQDSEETWIKADEDRLQQILINLLINAIRNTEAGSIVISSRGMNNKTEISIEDSGKGIPEEQRDSIFDSFQSGDRTGKKQGMGLGLSIVRELIRLHGSKIYLESTVGIGSRFYFTLDTVESAAHIDTPSIQLDTATMDLPSSVLLPLDGDNSVESTAKTKVLIVDDDISNHQVISGFLSDSNFLIDHALGGKDALKRFMKNRSDIILLDIMMPGMDGFEFCRRIRKSNKWEDLPILFLSAKNQLADLKEAFAVGGNDYLTKPFSKGELTIRIESLIRQSQMNRKFIHLAQFTQHMIGFHDIGIILQYAGQAIHCQIPESEIAIYQEDRVIYRFSHVESPSAKLNETSELARRFISIPDPVNPIYLLTNKHGQIKETDDVEIADIVCVKIASFQEHMIIVVFNTSSSPLRKLDIEFIRSVLHIIDMSLLQVKKFLEQTELVEAIGHINSNIDHILYIRSRSPFCDVYYKQSNRQTETSLPISMKSIQTFVNKDKLLRVHRSIFVNPKKVLKAQKKKGPDYELLLDGSTQDNVTINLGRNYIADVKKDFPQWF